MNVLQKCFSRIFQKCLYLGNMIIPMRVPKLIEGANAATKIPDFLKERNIDNVLIVTGKTILGLGMPNPLTAALKDKNINFTIYTSQPDPTITNVEEGLVLYNKNNCQAIIAFGGGSPIDTAKIIAARVAKPNKTVQQMKGLLKIVKRTPLVFAVPTTSGSGSEATLAAVITNAETHEKYAISDFYLIPSYVILDPTLTVGLNPHLTATTGMDALTHAVEAFIGNSNTQLTKKSALIAVKLIFENLLTVYIDGKNLDARENMQKASYFAGVAFTRAFVGHVHSIAHTLGGMYKISHGLANAVILPYVLDSYGATAEHKLAILAKEVGFGGDNDSVLAKAFISKIKEMNRQMNIPTQFAEIKSEDISLMSTRAYKESNPLYPTPKLFDKKDFVAIYEQLMLAK